MNHLKHTPKPWAIDPNDKDGCFVTADCDGLRVADCYNDERQLDDECAANARLIAAAPELLSCLISLLDKADREFKDSGIWVATREDAREAIKLATGN